MTTSQHQFADITRQSQEAMTNLTRLWAETFRGFAHSMAGSQLQPRDAQLLVDNMFDIAKESLSTQQRFVDTLLTTTAEATEVMSKQMLGAARSLTTHADEAVQATAD